MSNGGLEMLKETIQGCAYTFHAAACSNGFKARLALEL
jgi:hypothetical protein